MRLLVVTPAFNEGPSIGAVVSRIIDTGYSCLVVDDGSTDTTRISAGEAGATVLRMPFNSGVGGALRAGFVYAVRNGFDAIVQIDADGQHPSECIGDLIEAAQLNHADMVIGSRFFQDNKPSFLVGKTRRFAMRVLANRASAATGTRITDATSGFRLIRGQLLEELSKQLPAYYLGDTFEALVAAGQAGYRVIEVPVTMSERRFGVSSASSRQAAKWTLRALLTAGIRSYPRLARKTVEFATD